MIASLLFFPFIFRSLLVYFSLHGLFEYRAILAPVYKTAAQPNPSLAKDSKPDPPAPPPPTKAPQERPNAAEPPAIAEGPASWPLAAVTLVLGAASFTRLEVYGAALLASLSFLVILYPMLFDHAAWRRYFILDAFGVVYIVWCLNLCGIILQHPSGQGLVFMALSCSWIGDGGAYFIGSRYGRRRCHPAVSPGKTWEGVWAELFWTSGTALGLRWLHAAAAADLRLPHMSAPHCLALAAALTVAGVVGDLCESFIKRLGGAKDSGDFFPGHGGVLDRFDGFFFAAVLLLTYYALP